MAKKPHNDYESIRDKWYEKLKKDGFVDIEHNGRLKQWTASRISQNPQEMRDSKEAYYSLTDRFLREYTFDSTLEQVIWEYHSEGISAHNIAQILRDTKVKKTNRTTVNAVTKRLRSIMMQMYMPSQSEDL